MVKHSHRRNRRRLMAEINVVPYIDVMLVLLVIFMVTAPLINTGFNVNLPQERASPLPGKEIDSVLISVDQFGDYYIDVGKDKRLPATDKILYDRIKVVLTYNRETPIFVAADTRIDYGRVIHAMSVAQAAGAPQVGLITMPPEGAGSNAAP